MSKASRRSIAGPYWTLVGGSSASASHVAAAVVAPRAERPATPKQLTRGNPRYIGTKQALGSKQAGGQPIGFRWKARRDEPGRKGTRAR
jgi:hypothetical protein